MHDLMTLVHNKQDARECDSISIIARWGTMHAR